MAITDKKAFFDKMQKGFYAIAVGDALGAGIEAMNTKQIREQFGDSGVTHYIGNDWVKAGDVTDDTSTTACTILALVRTLSHDAPHSDYFQKAFLINLHQALLSWVKNQKFLEKDGNVIKAETSGKYIDPLITWPKDVEDLFTTPGIGISTIKTLDRGKMGTLEDRPETGGVTYKYSNGCGGMIRVMPIAVLCAYTNLDPYELGIRSAAVTHGDWHAIMGTGLLCKIMSHTIKNNSSVEAAVTETLSWTKTHLKEEKDGEKAQALNNFIEAMDMALKHATPSLTPEMIDNLNDVYFKAMSKDTARFQSQSVFLDALLTTISAERGQCDMKKSLQMAVNHSGDSDSVGTICGALLGIKGYQSKDIEPLYRKINMKYRNAINVVLADMSQELNIGNVRNIR